MRKKQKKIEPKRRNAQDLTLRNLRALKKQLALTQGWLIALAARCYEACGTDFVEEMANDLSIKNQKAKND